MPAPIAIAIVVKRLLAMMAVMETLSVPIDDDTVVVVPMMMMMMMSVGGDDERVRRSDRRRGQAQRQRAENEGRMNIRAGFCSCSDRLRLHE